MRAFLLGLVVTLAAGCTESSLGSDTAYRRLVDAYDTEWACLAGGLDACYQVITLCANGTATLDLESRPLRGTYLLDGALARAEMVEMRFDFDLETLSAPQLPGRHPWTLAASLTHDCAP